MGLMLVPQTLSLTASNVATSSLTEWASGSAYTTGQQRKVSFEADGTTPRYPVREYQATGDSTGSYPPDNPQLWALMGAQNRHRLLDGFNNSRTVADAGEDIEISVVPPGRAEHLYLVGLRNAASVVVEELVDATVVSTTTRDLLRSWSPVGVESWLYDVQNQDRFLAASAAIFLPGKLLQPTLRITIVSGDGPAECGQLLCGKGFYLGRTQFKSEPGLRDWSTFEQNALGITEHTPRDSTRTLRGTLRIETQDFDRVFTLLENQQKKLALFDFNNADTGPYTFDAHRIYGKLDSFTGPILFGETDINLTIKGTE